MMMHGLTNLKFTEYAAEEWNPLTAARDCASYSCMANDNSYAAVVGYSVLGLKNNSLYYRVHVNPKQG
jgi:hypothetical protein